MTEEPQDEWVKAMQENQKAKVKSPNRSDNYTKDRCPCHRCKKIVAELEVEIERMRESRRDSTNDWFKNLKELDERAKDRDATILRLRKLLRELDAIQQEIEVTDAKDD